MIPAISTARYVGEWELMSKLAEYLRRSREGRYAEMIEREQITANDAYRDEHARIAIAADWHAIATRSVRLDEPDTPPSWKVWTLEQAMTVFEMLIARMAERGDDIADHVDLRDATAHLLACYRNGWTGILLVRLRERAPAREVAA